MANWGIGIHFYLFTVCWLILEVPTLAATGRYPILNFTPSDYQAGIQNIDFAQNRDMQLFVANNLGVLSYNGTHWKVHAYKTGKKHRSLAFDEYNNRLYVGLQGDFGYFDGDWTYHSLIDLIPGEFSNFDEVWDVFLLDGLVYFCTFQHLYVYEKSKISAISRDGGFGKSFSVQGKLFTQSVAGEIFEVMEGELASFSSQETANQVVSGMVPHEDGYLLFYNSGNIEYLTPFASAKKYARFASALRGTYVNHAFQLSDSRLVVATQRAGLFLFDFASQTWEEINIADGLQSNACLRTYQDFSGNLWVGQQSGLSLIHINSPMRWMHRDAQLEGSGYAALAVEQGMYYTTSNGIYYFSNDLEKTTFLPGTEGPAYGLTVIAGDIYAGHHIGLFKLEGTQAKLVANTNGLWKIITLRSYPDVVLGGTYSGLHRFSIDNQNVLQSRGKLQGFDESSRFFEEDVQGNILVGQYYKGLFQIALKEDLSIDNVRNLSASGDLQGHEQLVLGSIENDLFLGSDQGIFRFDAVTSRLSDVPIITEVIGSQPVYLIQQDRQKNIHIIAENLVGFFKQISPNNFSFVPSSLYQHRYELNTDLLNASIHLDDGIMFSANLGFLHYRPENEARIDVERPLLIKRVRNVTKSDDLYLRLPFEDKPKQLATVALHQRAKVLQIELESYQFRNHNNQQFRYFLDGFDENFSDWTSSAVKEYTNLKEGDYRFVAQTRNYLGSITESIPLGLTVHPPFHRSHFAKVLYVLSGIFMLGFVYRLEKKRYERRARRLVAEKKDELDAKQQKLVEIEQQKDKELMQLEEEKMASELRHLNNLLAASTMNLVVKNEFIETIKEEIKEIRRKGKDVETKRALERMEREIDTTLRLQEDWEQFEYHFDKVHGDFLTRIRDEFGDLTPNDQKLCAFLRLNLNTKEIANLMSISLRGAEIARYRLRMKLKLKKGQNLSKFILEY